MAGWLGGLALSKATYVFRLFLVSYAASLACVPCEFARPMRARSGLAEPRGVSERVPASKIKPCETLMVPLTT